MNEHLKKLMADRAKKAQRLRELLDGAKTEKRSLSDEEAKEYDKVEKELDSINADIERTQRQIQRERELESLRTPPLGGARTDGTAGDGEEDDKNEKTYERAFVKAIRGARLNDDESKLIAQRALNTGTDNKGGFLVPESWQNEILDLLPKVSNIRKLITVRRTSSTTNIPLDSDEIELGWLDEYGEYPETEPTFGNKQLEAHKQGGVVILTRELIADSLADVKKYVIGKLTKGIAKGEAKAFISGDGDKKPRGIKLDATNYETQASGSIAYQDLVNIKYAVPADKRENARWRVSDAFAKTVESMTDGNGRPIWTSGSIKEGTPPSLLGFPVDFDNSLDDTVTGGKVVALFGDFSYYVAGDRGSIYLQVLTEKYATKGAVGVLIDKRVDGKLLDSTAIAKMTIKE